VKIAFIAMSGIRVCDTALLEWGLTLPGFVERSKQIASLPSLGLLTLAGMTPAEHEIEYMEVADLYTDDKIADLAGDFDLVAISSFSAQIFEAYELADRIRSRGMKVVMGGIHVTSMPDEAAKHCDAVVVGEGELYWLQVLEDTKNGCLQKRYGSYFEEFNLADAPMPAFELLDIDKYNRITVQTSRGCTRKCEFCASSILLTSKYKQKPIEKVLAEIDKIRDIWSKPFIELADDNSFIHREYWRRLLPKIAERKIRWFTETELSVWKDPGLLRLLRESGCAQILIGLESPTQTGLDGIELNNNWKMKQWPKYKEAIKTIQSYGISVNGCFVVGLDNQDTGIFDLTLDYAAELELSEVQVTIQTPFPGTPLFSRLEADGRILEPGAWNKCTLFDINYQPARMSVDELRSGFKYLVGEMYSKERTDKRKRQFKRRLQESRSLLRSADSHSEVRV
jgi:radical SAM superfamily enzyme YgiQ (UPF0313 family)